jgi:hypothetical protein
MPCDNVAETARLKFDNEERLVSYTLQKLNCAASLGDCSLLLPRLRGKTVSEILAFDSDSFFDRTAFESDIERFLSLKHFFAIISVLESLTGIKAGGGPDSQCTIVELNYGDDGFKVEADISIGLVTSQIKACGNCGCN